MGEYGTLIFNNYAYNMYGKKFIRCEVRIIKNFM